MAMRSGGRPINTSNVDASNNLRNQIVSKMKQADEFIDLGRPDHALYIFQEVLHNKQWVLHDKIWSLTILEPIMFQYLKLCVDLLMSDAAINGLIQYRNMFQLGNPPKSASMERVVIFYLNMAEKQTESASYQYARALDGIGDLSNTATPESITSTVFVENAQNCADKILTPWVKFLWDSYCQILEVFCTNVHLNTLYHKITCMAFKFCVKFSKTTEFKKVCHKFGKHLITTCKKMVRNKNVCVCKPETLQLNMETTLFQLDCAIQLQLWQEVYKIVENIHSLMTTSKKAPPAKIKVKYYSQLALLFWKTEYYSFHAAALLKLFQLSRDTKFILTQEQLKKMASRVLAAVLSVPLINPDPGFGRFVKTNEDPLGKVQRFAILMYMTQPPTRESLLEDVVRLNVVKLASPQLQQLYSWLEVEFDLLTICKNVNGVIKSINDEPGSPLVQYGNSLRDVALVKLMRQMEQYYSCVKFDRLMTMTDSEDLFHLERVLVNCVTYDHMRIAIDHADKCVNFGIEVNGNVESYSSANDDVCKWLGIGCNVLSRAVHAFYSARFQLVRANFVQHYRNNEHAERQRFLQRLEIMKYLKQRQRTLVKAQSFQQEHANREQRKQNGRRAEKEELQRICSSYSNKRISSSKKLARCEPQCQDYIRQQNEYMDRLYAILNGEKLQRQEDWIRDRCLERIRAEREKTLAVTPRKAARRVRERREHIMVRNEIMKDVHELCEKKEVQRQRKCKSKRRLERKLRRKRAAETARAELNGECQMNLSAGTMEEQRKLDARLKSQKKKVESFERAKKMVEVPLLQSALVEKRMLEEASLKRQEKERIDRLKEEWSRDSVTAERLGRMHVHRDEFIAIFHAERADAYQDRLRAFEAKLFTERERRRRVIRKRREAFHRRVEAERRELERVKWLRQLQEAERLHQRSNHQRVEAERRELQEAESLRQCKQSKKERRRRKREEAKRDLNEQRKNEAMLTRTYAEAAEGRCEDEEQHQQTPTASSGCRFIRGEADNLPSYVVHGGGNILSTSTRIVDMCWMLKHNRWPDNKANRCEGVRTNESSRVQVLRTATQLASGSSSTPADVPLLCDLTSAKSYYGNYSISLSQAQCCQR